MPTRPPGPAIRTCGCPAEARWRCDRCNPERHEFLACSLRCLGIHRRGSHAAADTEAAPARARQEQRALNQDHQRNWNMFAGHRDRLMRLVTAVQRGEGLCVLGAGNGDDLDLPLLLRQFRDVHLVDIDADALERAAARVAGPARDRLTLHGDVDLSGLIDSVESWGEPGPGGTGGDAALAELARAAPAALAARIGRTFDVVLSSGVLSQLCAPFYRLLARRAPEWEALARTVGGLHLQTVALLTREGGTGVAVGDTVYALKDGEAHPPLAPLPAEAPGWEAVDPAVTARMRQGVMRLRDPVFLGALFKEAPLADLVEIPRLTEPWLWHVEEAVMLAYALIFRRS